MTTDELLQRVDELIEMGKAVLATRHRETYIDKGPYRDRPPRQVSGPEYVDGGMLRGFRAASLSFIVNVYGEKHPHFTEFAKIPDLNDPSYVKDDPSYAKEGLGILQAIRGEIEGGWLYTVRSRVTAEVFTDYMEMAEYLLELIANGKDPAAVIAGSTLEAHLRQLCMKNGIPVTQSQHGKDAPLTGEPLNIALAKAGIYSSVDRTLITGWLCIRNSAAHGKYARYNTDHVKGMITGIREFMARNPA
jgi:hypothetical protein